MFHWKCTTFCPDTKTYVIYIDTLRWRHNGHHSVSNHQPHHCLLNGLFGCRSKKTSKLRVTGLCVGNSPVPGEFPAQRTSNAENVSIWLRHHIGMYNFTSQPHTIQKDHHTIMTGINVLVKSLLVTITHVSFSDIAVAKSNQKNKCSTLEVLMFHGTIEVMCKF